MIESQIDVGSDFSGIGAFDQSLMRLGINYKSIFACDKDKYARQSYIANYGQPEYFPFDVYHRLIPEKSLDIYMTSPPCQAFSLAGKRKGEDDKRGILFYNSHEFIIKNNPRYFLFENVKGLLSDNNGKTFNNWINLLGGKSVNGNPVMFPLSDAAHYHIYWKVLNAKHYGVPQNRERVFIVGIRDDCDNNFSWPKQIYLTKMLKDVLEVDVDEKYYLSEKMISYLSGAERSLPFTDPNVKQVSNCVLENQHKMSTDQEYFKVKSATKKGFEVATKGDSINLSNLSNLNSETRCGRVGKGVEQTLDTSCDQAVMVAHVGRSEEGERVRKESVANGKDYTPFQAKEVNFKKSDVMNCVTTATTKDNLIIDHRGHKNKAPNIIENGIVPTLRAESHGHQPKVFDDYNIRRLTPRECFRLMGFPDSFKFIVSDTQLYKQAGNSIVVEVLKSIIEKFNLKKNETN